MFSENANNDFHALLSEGAERARTKAMEIFSDERTSVAFLDFLETEIKRGRARKVISFIERNRLESVFPQLLPLLARAAEKAGDKQKAAETYLQTAENFADASYSFYNAARMFFELSNFDKAELLARKALKTKGEFPEARFLLGNVYRKKNDFISAIAEYEKALEYGYEPAADVYYNLGVVSEKLFEYDAALNYYNKALALNETFAEAHWNKALILLREKAYVEGWREFEWRKGQALFALTETDLPECGVGEIGGEGKILLYAEQGFGDAIQFLRFVLRIKTKRVSIVVKEELKRLFEASGFFERVYSRDEEAEEEFDCAVSLLSLPYLLNAGSDVALDFPLWKCEPKKKGKTVRAGIVWRGNPLHENDKYRSMNLETLLDALQIPGLEIYSLQAGPKNAGERELLRARGVTDYGESVNDFLDTAEKICGLDAVISVDTATAHLAASMFVPVFLLSPKNSDWRWGENKGKSDWYPTLKIYGQKKLGDWRDVLAKLENDLRAFVNSFDAFAIDEAAIFEKAAALDRKGESRKALSVLLEAYNAGAHSPEMIFNLALAYHKAGALDEAERFYKMLSEKIESEEVYYNYILLLFGKNDLQTAEPLVQKALASFPDSGKINSLAGDFFKRAEKYELALAYYDKALRFGADYRSVRINTAAVYFVTGEMNNAARIYADLIKENPGDAEARYNLALVYQEKKNYVEALREIDVALSVRDDARFHLAKAEILLTLEQFERGLREYEYRLSINPPLLSVKYPDDVTILRDKKILVFEEQGIGDTIQFARYCKKLAEHNSVTFAARPALVSLLQKQSYLERVVTLEEARRENFDYSIPVVSLFALFYEKEKSLPAFGKYIVANKIPLSDDRIKIGVAWRGNPYPTHQRKRHFDVELLEKLFAQNGFGFYPLLKDLTEKEKRFLSRFENVVYDEKHFTTIENLAALINSLDRIVTVDTLYAHLAGALGKKTYTLLHYSPDWRWKSEGETVEWYPTMTLIRQKEYGRWDFVTDELLRRIKTGRK